MAGIISQQYKTPSPQQAPINSKQQSKKKETYAASIEQSANDYDELMWRYKDILDGGVDPQVTALMKQYQSLAGQTYSPIEQTYQRSSDMNAASSNLSDLALTGGYSSQGISDLRSRGLSPIRSVYANAMQNITRQKALQGGYSPNYTAALAHLTRGLSNDISQGTQNVNAGIAQNVASNRISASGTYGNFAQNETGAMNDIGARNASRQDNAAQFNNANQSNSLGALTSLYQGQQNQKQNALSGMQGLYGTTPANPALYGSQALQRANLEQSTPIKKRKTGGVSLGQQYQ